MINIANLRYASVVRDAAPFSYGKRIIGCADGMSGSTAAFCCAK